MNVARSLCCPALENLHAQRPTLYSPSARNYPARAAAGSGSRGLTMGPGTGSIESPQHQIPPPQKTACRRLKTGALLESAAQSSRRRTFTQDAGELCARRTQRLCARACPHAMRSAAIFPAEVPLRCRGLPTNSQRGLVTGLLYRHSCAEEQFTVPGWPGQAAEDCECQVCWHPLVHLSDKISLPEGGRCS